MEVNDIKYLKEVQEKINKTAEQLSMYTETTKEASDEGHGTNEDALMALAEIISDIEARVTELEGKIDG